MGNRSFILAMARAAQASARAHERAQRQALREQEALARKIQRQRIADEKERQRLYVESRQNEVADMNQELHDQIQAIKNILISGLNSPAQVDLDSLLVSPSFPIPDYRGLETPTLAPDPLKFKAWTPPWFLIWIPFFRNNYLHRQRILKEALDKEIIAHNKKEHQRTKLLEQKRVAHESACQKETDRVEKINNEINSWKADCEAGENSALANFYSLLLAQSKYPEGFPCESKFLYAKDSRQLIVNYFLPEIEAVVPTAKAYKYIKSQDDISMSTLPEKERRQLYSDLIAQVSLRCVFEIFHGGKQFSQVDTVIFNGFVNTIDLATGRDVSPCLITVRITSDMLNSLNLHNVDPIVCLRQLSASVSRSPAELAPVRPIIEMDMNDPRFIAEMDVLSDLDQRPNLMDLTPAEFESLITNLFAKMGLETKLTQASRDGGVDCVAFDQRPILGGKVVIQAKRYKNTVGVGSVRDLFGTLQNEGASKGILVTTSGYGAASFEFAKGKPIELIDGGHLLYLLKEHANVDAKIIMPVET